MERIILFIIVIFFIIPSRSQHRAAIRHKKLDTPVKILFSDEDENHFLSQPLNPSVTVTMEAEAGNTWYDRASFGSLSNRMIHWDDATMSLVWTFGFISTQFPDRGTGYNFFDGDSWGPIPQVRIESVKTGWPSIAPLGENGEIIVSHNDINALVINKRPQKGYGPWSESWLMNPPGSTKLTFPRMVTSGPDNSIVHIIAQVRDDYYGQYRPPAYYRSSDGGETWDIQHHIFDEAGPGLYTVFSSDEISFAEPRANTIAFLLTSNLHDLVLMKSTDNGDNWQKTVIWQHPYPMWDVNTTIMTDTLWAPDNSGDIALDSEGNAHVVFGLTRFLHDELGPYYQIWPVTDGIVYWNEFRPPFEDPSGNPHDALDAWDVLIENENLVGWTQDVDGNGIVELEEEIMTYTQFGLSTMPNIAINEQSGEIILSFASTTEGYSNTVNNFKHIWLRTANNSGNNQISWDDDFTDMNQDVYYDYKECIFPNMSDDSRYICAGLNYYLNFQIDDTPGLALDDIHPYQENDIMAFKPYNTGIPEKVLSFGEQAVSQVIYTHDKGSCMIRITLDQPFELGYELYNLFGQRIYRCPVKDYQKGIHLLNIDLSGLNPGIYFCSIFSGKEKVLRKILVSNG